MLLDFADFALQEQLEENLMVSVSRAWYNGSYTMAAINQIVGIALYNDPVFNKCYISLNSVAQNHGNKEFKMRMSCAQSDQSLNRHTPSLEQVLLKT